MKNGDKGGGGGKNRDFYGDILFEWPLREGELTSTEITLLKNSSSRD